MSDITPSRGGRSEARHLGSSFATERALYDLDEKTRALLAFATKLTEAPGMVEDSDSEALRIAGWDAAGIWQATALVSFFNFTGRLEAAAGLPSDQVPTTSRFLRDATRDARPASGSENRRLRRI